MAVVLFPRLAALWVLVGAVSKLLTGSPRDLPVFLHDLPLDDVLTFQVVISIELLIGVLGLLIPRRAWPLLLLLLLAFVTVLLQHLGDPSCGCMGSALTISPLVMLGVDLVLIGLLLVGRPWRARIPSSRAVIVALVLAVAAAAVPWFWRFDLGPGSLGDGPPWIDLGLDSWVGKPLTDLPIAETLGELALREELEIVFWQLNCTHCADHLERLRYEREAEPTTVDLVLIRLRYYERKEEKPAVTVKPEGFGVHELDAPPRPEWTFTPPVHVVVSGGRVVEVRTKL